jgi:hypothetical protein
MKRRAYWLAVVGSAALGLAMPGQSGMQRHAFAADDPQSLPALALTPAQSPASSPKGDWQDDPFAPISVEQFLPATSRGSKPGESKSAMPASGTVSAGYNAPPGSISSANAIVPPTPIATAAPSPLMGAAHHWDAKGAAGDGCPTCGAGGSCGFYSSLIENMSIFAGADYFTNAGGLDPARLRRAADELGHEILEKSPDLDPQRLGSMLSINAGVPFTPDAELGFQLGATYVEEDDGAQAFITAGFYHRGEPGEHWCINWGVVFDYKYDDFIDYSIGQLRFKAGYPLTARDEIGGWFTVPTNVEEVDLIVSSVIIGTGAPVFRDNIRARVSPMGQGHFFWHHIFDCGWDTTIWTGARGGLGGAFITGATANIPINDCWAFSSGGHWSKDSDDQGSWDVYLGFTLFPGGNAHVTNSCGNRFLPYQDAANNTFMPTKIDPRFLQINPVGLPPVRAKL